VEPNTSLAAEAGIRLGSHKGILTDQRQTTSDDSIYAAGDCCEVRNIITNKWSYIPLATTASKQGWTAGENAAGGSSTFKGVIRAIGVKVFDLEVAHVGLSSREAREAGFDPVIEQIEAPSRISFFPGSQQVHIIAVADRNSKRILGANVYGKDGAMLRANVLAVAIQHGLTVDDVARLDLIYTPPFSPLWDPVLVMGNQLRKRIENEKSDHH
jgi:NADPH-dependent 2,4-dienoyl-CoA reductase/sulfur reductase-like enzyme